MTRQNSNLVYIVMSYVIGLVALMAGLVRCQRNNISTTTLRIAIPVRELTEFVRIKHNHNTGTSNYSGFAIEVFEEVVNHAIPNRIDYQFVPYQNSDGVMNGTFDDMLKAVFDKDYDGAIGEISILYSRTQWVDFTMPFLESSITMLVPINQQETTEDDEGYSLKGITNGIVITTFVLGFIAFLVAAIYATTSIRARLRVQGNNANLLRDKTLGALIQARLMMITFFLLLVTLNACYILTQTSPNNSSQRKNGTVKNLTQLIRKGSNVGYREGSFIHNLLLLKGFPESNLISLKTEGEMVDMLSKGSLNGGVDAIVANAPHLKLLQAKHCDNFTLVPTTNLLATGFGFAFRKGSPFIDEISNGILKIVDNGKLGKIQDRTIGSLETCQNDDSNNNNNVDVFSSFLSPNHKCILIFGGILVCLLTLVSFLFLF